MYPIEATRHVSLLIRAERNQLSPGRTFRRSRPSMTYIVVVSIVPANRKARGPVTAGFPIFDWKRHGQSIPHIPPQHDGAPQEHGSEEPPLLPLLTTGIAISEILRATLLPPHCGQAVPASRRSEERIASKSLLQSRQMYSYNGIVHTRLGSPCSPAHPKVRY